MSPSRPRPPRVDVVEAHERDDGVLLVWADVGGKELVFQIPPGALLDRRLAYGLARVDVTINPTTNERTEVVVDLVADADEQVWRLIFEEHLDRFEDTVHDWHEQEPPPRPSQTPGAAAGRRIVGRRPEFERPFPVRARAPERLANPPHGRAVYLGADGLPERVLERDGVTGDERMRPARPDERGRP